VGYPTAENALRRRFEAHRNDIDPKPATGTDGFSDRSNWQHNPDEPMIRGALKTDKKYGERKSNRGKTLAASVSSK
jgi:hypothetical protein